MFVITARYNRECSKMTTWEQKVELNKFVITVIIRDRYNRGRYIRDRYICDR